MSQRYGRDPWLSLALFAGLLAIYGSFHHSRDWNTTSRLLLTFSLVQDGSIEVTPFVTLHGRLMENPPTRDLCISEGVRFHCDKAPTQSLLGVLPYAGLLAIGIVDPQPHGSPAIAYDPADYFLTLATSGVLGAAAAVIVFLLLRRIGVRRVPAMAAALAHGLATSAYPYATLYYGHVAAGFFAIASIGLLGLSRSWPASVMAGVLAGIAVTVEYTLAALPVTTAAVLIGVWLFGDRRAGPSRWLAYVLGGLPIAVLLGAYHTAVTGWPFDPPYRYEVEGMFAYRSGSAPIGWPERAALWGLLCDPRFGLVTNAPVVLGAIPGFVRMFRRRAGVLAAMLGGTFLGLFLLIAGFPLWQGGLTTGPRLLTPGFVLLAIPLGYWLGSPRSTSWLGSVDLLARIVWSLVAVASVLDLTTRTAAGARLPAFVEQPLSLAWHTIAKGEHEPFLGSWLADSIGAGPITGLVFQWLFVLSIAGGLLGSARQRDRRDPITT